MHRCQPCRSGRRESCESGSCSTSKTGLDAVSLEVSCMEGKQAHVASDAGKESQKPIYTAQSFIIQPPLPSRKSYTADGDQLPLCPCMHRVDEKILKIYSCCTYPEDVTSREAVGIPSIGIMTQQACKGALRRRWAYCEHVQCRRWCLPLAAMPLVLPEHGLPAGSCLSSSVLPLQPALRALRHLISRHVLLALLQDVVNACASDWRRLHRLPAQQQLTVSWHCRTLHTFLRPKLSDHVASLIHTAAHNSYLSRMFAVSNAGT